MKGSSFKGILVGMGFISGRMGQGMKECGRIIK